VKPILAFELDLNFESLGFELKTLITEIIYHYF